MRTHKHFIRPCRFMQIPANERDFASIASFIPSISGRIVFLKSQSLFNQTTFARSCRVSCWMKFCAYCQTGVKKDSGGNGVFRLHQLPIRLTEFRKVAVWFGCRIYLLLCVWFQFNGSFQSSITSRLMVERSFLILFSQESFRNFACFICTC